LGNGIGSRAALRKKSKDPLACHRENSIVQSNVGDSDTGKSHSGRRSNGSKGKGKGSEDVCVDSAHGSGTGAGRLSGGDGGEDFFLRSCAIKALVLFKHPLFSHPLLSMSVDGRTQPRMSVEMMQELHSAFTGTSLIGQLTGQPLRADQDIFCGEQGEVGKPHSEASWLVDRL
jgi:hypothetical protein